MYNNFWLLYLLIICEHYVHSSFFFQYQYFFIVHVLMQKLTFLSSSIYRCLELHQEPNQRITNFISPDTTLHTLKNDCVYWQSTKLGNYNCVDKGQSSYFRYVLSLESNQGKSQKFQPFLCWFLLLCNLVLLMID